MVAGFEGYQAFEDFVAEAKKTDAREVVISVVSETQAKRAGSHSFVAQPVVRFLCSIEKPDPTDSDPLATTTVTWAVSDEPRTGAEEQAALRRIVKALRSRGFSVSIASSDRYLAP